MLKIPGPTGIISIKADVKGVVYCTECLFESVAASVPDDADHSESSSHPPTKQRISPDSTTLTKTVRLGDDPEKTVTVGAELGEK